MTNRLADAYDLLAEAYATLALELRNPAVERGGPETPGAPSLEELPFDEPPEWREDIATVTAEPHGSAAVCPKHRIPYRPGRYGPFCSALSDEPEWSNDKGYCRITPKNAAVWLRQHAA
jgi:hypothetical protein